MWPVLGDLVIAPFPGGKHIGENLHSPGSITAHQIGNPKLIALADNHIFCALSDQVVK